MRTTIYWGMLLGVLLARASLAAAPAPRTAAGDPVAGPRLAPGAVPSVAPAAGPRVAPIADPRVSSASAPRVAPPPAASSPASLASLGAADRASFDTLARLGAAAPGSVVAGLEDAARSGLGLFEAPVLRLLDAAEPTVRAAAAAALARLQWPATNEALARRIARLAARARDDSPAVRLAAIRAIGAYPVPEGAAALRELARSGNEADSRAARAALVALADPGAIERLARWLRRTEDAPTPPPPVEAARRLVAAPGGEDAWAALELLATLEPATAVRPFVHLAARQGTVSLSVRATDVMGEAPAAGDVPVLLELLDSPSPTARMHAARVLTALAGEPGVAAALARRLAAEQRAYAPASGAGEEGIDRVALMRAEAAVLRRAPTQALVPALEPLLGASSGYARELAIFLLRERKGRDTIWARTRALWIDPSDEARGTLEAEPLADRQAALLPHLAEVGPGLEKTADLLALVSPLGAGEAPAALALLDGRPAPELVAAVARATAEAPDAVVVPVLAAGLARTGPPRTRLAFYEALLGRGSDAAVGATAAALRGEERLEVAAGMLQLVHGRSEPPLREAVRARLSLREDPAVARAAVLALEPASDPELVGRVATLARSPDEALAKQAYERLRTERGELADTQVRRLAEDPGVVGPVRVLAIGDLGARGTLDDRSLLEDVLRRGSGPERLAARKALHVLVPDVYPAWDNAGRLPLIAGSAAFGAGLMGMVTQIAERDGWLALLGTGGGAIGGITAYLLTLDRDVSLGGAGYFVSLGTWGALGGYSLSRVTGLSGGTQAGALWGSVAGEVLGAGIGALTIESAAFDASDVVLAHVLASSVGLAAVSGTYLARAERPGRTLSDAFTLGAAGTMVPMALLGRRLELSKIDPTAVLVSTGLATWLGAFAPRAFTDDPREHDVLAGIGLGQAFGLVGGVALSQVRPFTPRSAMWLGIGGLTGTALGAGSGLAWPELHGRATYQLLELGAIVGAAAGAYFGPDLELHGTDIPLAVTMAIAGAIAGSGTAERAVERAGLSGIESPRTEKQLWGGRLLGTSVGLVAGLTLSQLVDLSWGELAMSMAAAGALGAGAGGVALLSPRLDDQDWFSPLFSAGAAVGGLGVALLAPRLRYGGSDVGLGLSAMLLGGFAGGLTPAYWTAADESVPRVQTWGGVMAGAATGMAAAAALSQAVEVTPERVLRIDLGALGGMAFGAGLGLVSPAIGRTPTVALLQAGTAVGFLATGLLDRDHVYAGSDRLRLVLGAGVGAAAGTLVPALWRRGGIPGDERWGGALLGMSAAAALARVGVAAAPRDAQDVGETAVFTALGASAGSGAYALRLGARGDARALFAGTLLGWGAGELASGSTGYSATDVALVTTLVAQGWIGGLAVPRWTGNPDDARSRIAGGALAGGILGLGGMALAQSVDLEVPQLVEGWWTSALGASVGYGAAYALGDSPAGPAAAAAGLWGGLALGLSASGYTAYSATDVALVTTLLAQGWIGGLAVPRWTGHPDDARSRIAGGALAGGILGLGGMALSQAVDVEVPQLVEDWWMSALGASVGYGAAYALGDSHAAPAAAAAGLWGGLALGLSASGSTRYSATDAALVTTLVAQGWMGGLAVPRWTGNPDDARGRIAGGALAGGILGLGGVALSQAVELEVPQLVEGWWTSGLGAAVGYGAAHTLGHSSVGPSAAAAGLWAGLALGLSASPWTRYDDGDVRLVQLLSAEGAAAGLVLPDWLGDDSAEDRAAGAALGLGALGIGGLALAQVTDYDAGELRRAMTISTLGAAGAWGLAEAWEPHARRSRAIAGAALLGGLSAGLLAAPSLSISSDDDAWMVAGGLLGGWLGYRLPDARLGDAARSQSRWSGALGGAAVGTLLAGAAAQAFERSPGDAVLGLVLGTGLTLGVEGVAELGFSASAERRALAAQTAAVAGFAAGALLGPASTFDGDEAWTMAAFSTLGAWHGGFLPRALGHEPDPGSGAVSGAGFGLVLGYGVSQVLHPSAALDAELLGASGIGSLVGYGLGMMLDWSERDSQRGLEVGSVAALGLGAAVVPALHLRADDAGLLAAGALWGAWHGAWLGELLGDSDSGSGRVGGGAMVGSGVGLAAGAALSSWMHRRGSDIVEASVLLGAGNLVGKGVGDLLLLGDASTYGLMEAAGVAGLAAGLALSPSTTYSPSDMGLLVVSSGLLATHGVMLRGLFAAEDEPLGQRGIMGGASVGAGIGLAGGMLLAQRLELGAGDLAEIVLATACGDAVGFGLAQWTGLRGPGLYGAVEAGAIGALTLGLVAAQSTSYTKSDRLLIGWGATLGGWLGGWAPGIWGGDASDHGAGILLGVGAGGLAAAALAQRLSLDARDAGEVMVGSSLSTAIGVGLGLVLSRDDRVWTGLMQATGLAGAAAVAALAPSTEYSREDVTLGLLVTTYAVYQGAGVSILANATNRQVAGAMLAAGAGGALAGTYVGRRLHFDQTQMMMLLAGSAWGMWIGVWSAPLIADLRSSDRSVYALGVGTTALASDVALAVTALGISKLVEMPPRRFAWINLSGGFGVVVGATVAALSGGTSERRARSFQTGLVLGSVAGLGVGTLVTSFFEFTPRRPVAQAAEGGLGLAAMLPGIDMVIPSVQVVPRDPARGGGDPDILFTLVGSFR